MVWLILFILFTIISAYPIEIPLSQSKMNIYYLSTCLGTPKQCFDLGITSEETNILLYSNCNFISEFSTTYKVIGTEPQFIECSDKLTLSNEAIINDVRFIKVKINKKDKLGNFGIGLARNSSDPYNILNQLLKNAPKRVFYFDAPRLVFGYGDYPPQYHNSRSKNVLQKKCKLILDHAPHDTGYYCILNSIFYYTESETVFYPINRDVSISFGLNGLQVPLEFYYLIKKTYLKAAIKNYDCSENENNEDFFYLICPKDFNEDSLGYLTAVIGNWSFRINPQDLFMEYKNNKVFLMMSSIKRSTWSFGYALIKNYIRVIDLDAMEISFIKPSIA